MNQLEYVRDSLLEARANLDDCMWEDDRYEGISEALDVVIAQVNSLMVGDEVVVRQLKFPVESFESSEEG